MNKERSPNGKVFGEYCAFYDGQNVIFDNCKFDAADRQLPVFNKKELEFINCKFIQNSNHNFRAIATFKGTTRFVVKGQEEIDTSNATFEGIVLYDTLKMTEKENKTSKNLFFK